MNCIRCNKIDCLRTEHADLSFVRKASKDKRKR